MERSDSAFDLERALDMVEGDADLLAATARSFTTQNLTRRGELGDAVARGESDTVERIAHGLTGAAQNFAADEVESAARALGEAAAAGDVPAFPTLYERLETALAELNDALSSYSTRQDLRHVLVAEDDDVTRMRLESLLRKWNYRVTSVSRGDVALELLGSGPPHLAVVDWVMPGLDGLELCRALRARKNDAYTYVILVTAKDEPDAMVTGLEAGADDFIAKPVMPEELRARLRAGQRIVELQERLLARSEEQRVHADRDGLTGMLSQRRVTELLGDTLECQTAGGERLSVALIDIDGLRRINENNGRSAGDQLLRAACERMQAALRHADFFGRFGGDEFLAVMPGLGRSEATEVAQRMCRALASSPVEWGEGQVALSATAGVAEAEAGTSDVEELLKAANQALSWAKNRADEG